MYTQEEEMSDYYVPDKDNSEKNRVCKDQINFVHLKEPIREYLW